MLAPFFRIRGRTPLNGTIAVSGSKNAAFPLLAAAMLAAEPLTFENVPDIEDIRCFLALLEDLGCRIEWHDAQSLSLDSQPISKTVVSPEQGGKIRGSYYLLGSLLARCGQGSIPSPGGCAVGERPMDLHLAALRQLGFTLKETANGIEARREKKMLDYHEITFPFPSRGATINLLLASSLLAGHTLVLQNANTSPEACALEAVLHQLGARIEGQGTSTVVIHGVHALRPSAAPIRVIPDKIEAATLLCAGLITGGTLCVEAVVPQHLEAFLRILHCMGVPIERDEQRIQVHWVERLNPVSFVAGVEPGDLDADWEPLIAAVNCTLSGTATIQDRINPERHSKFLPALNQMGAQIVPINPTTAYIYGGTTFHGAQVMAQDIRGGAALTLAALAAEGISTVSNVSQIDRGYVSLEQKLHRVGASIERCDETPFMKERA